MADYDNQYDHYDMTEVMRQQNQAELELSAKLPIKNHLERLDMTLENLLKDLEDSKKDLQSLRNDVVSLGHLNNDQCSELSRFVMDETLRLAKDFRKLTNIEQDECTYLKQQVNQLTQDRIRLQQNTLVLENRVNETEKDVGFRHMYD
ncbi:hypothetical protein TTHERM_00529510 (macronuclear) [Tetrahymena thermophila SB210]|uniref:Uncharacterized protein n=1 Tax=Tetrahymena thermophila (strain SB210) TaxID=312017 RepID=I7MCV5_TETTS|nr:hypothetical protein TTHERM_00529510 [Tetrahymena thermophila SB210]EAR84999.1 hypothetical protein TTHERM_00529510 [Tetrahymena thermophila SB210]|eukprot:XP_001032662.1 hypothetical protein TTHERM_00529510 [Tetrahymena thermophila SB210]